MSAIHTPDHMPAQVANGRAAPGSGRGGIRLALLLAAGALASFAATSVGQPLLPVVLVAGMLGVVGLYLRPALGLAALVAVVFTNAAAVFETRHGLPIFNQLLVPVLIAIVAMRWVFRREMARDLPIVAAMFGAYAAVTALSLFYARDPDVSSEHLVMLAKDMVVGLVVVALMSTASRFRVVCRTIVLSAGGLSLLGILQAATGDFGNDFGGFSQASVQHIAGRLDAWRLTGPLTDPNFYAQMLLIALPIALDRLLHGRFGADRLLGLLAVPIVIAIALTYSRGALLGVGAIIAAMVWLEGRRRAAMIALVAVVVAVLALPIIPGEYSDRLAAAAGSVQSLVAGGGGGPDEAVSGRVSEMLVAVHLFLDNPLIGVGYGQFESYYQDTAMMHGLMARGADREAHSLYLQVLAERGLIGVLPFALLLWLAFRSGLRAAAQFETAGRSSDAALARAVVVGLFGYMTAATFLHDDYQRYFWLAIAVALALPQATESEGLPLLRLMARMHRTPLSDPEPHR